MAHGAAEGSFCLLVDSCFCWAWPTETRQLPSPLLCLVETPSPGCWPGTALLGLGIPPAPIPCWRLPCCCLRVFSPEADALHCQRLCFHATEVPVESKLFDQRASGWRRRPQGWVCRSDLTMTQQPFVPAHSLPAGAGPNSSGPSLAECAHTDISLGGPGQSSRAGVFRCRARGLSMAHLRDGCTAMSYCVGGAGVTGWPGRASFSPSAHLPSLTRMEGQAKRGDTVTAELTCSPVTLGDCIGLTFSFCFQVECRIRACLAVTPFSSGLWSCQAEALLLHTHLPCPSTLLSQPLCSLTAEPEGPSQE